MDIWLRRRQGDVGEQDPTSRRRVGTRDDHMTLWVMVSSFVLSVLVPFTQWFVLFKVFKTVIYPF